MVDQIRLILKKIPEIGYKNVHACFFLFSLMLTVSLTMFLLSVGLAKRVGARLLLASTSEVYGGKLVGLARTVCILS